MAFFGMVVAMGLARLPCYDDYWARGIMRMPWFASIMFRKRFRDILRYFHLVDNRKNVEKGHPNYSKLFKLGGLEEKLSKTFSDMYHPGQNLSIDEQMIGMKSRVGFIQYMPKKPKKFGVKVWACCEAESSFCLKFQIYTGASDTGAEHGLSHRVVFDLMENYLDRNYHLFIDNFYTSLNLIKSLKDRQTYACGTIRTNRGEFPKRFKEGKLDIGKSMYI
ncbi:piggyBac transposable element-derived protein 4-like isoform X1 [Hydractinia symbiolongicarpus]|uniref:piggyBac transposable element-derived protein 4-like isoform X1 n=1 Tax=Hydractinia symbiolongicarpus TaxID=13093 RepID=UPI00254B1C3C|nr:piggyBac transposable element-derived protein 4-like isoform X1 [Hydractinia symbiolongicarpus]